MSKGWKQHFVKVTCGSLGSNMPEGFEANRNIETGGVQVNKVLRFLLLAKPQLNKVLCQRTGSNTLLRWLVGALGATCLKGLVQTETLRQGVEVNNVLRFLLLANA